MNNVIDIKQLEATAAVAKNYVLEQAESTIDSISAALGGSFNIDYSHCDAVQSVTDITGGKRISLGADSYIDVTF